MKKQHKTPGLHVWLGAILLVGAFIGGLVWLSMSEMTPPPRAPETVVSENDEGSRFDFYHVLPNDEVVVEKQGKDVPKLSHYILQVAAVKRFAEADSLKAQLTLLGYDVKIDKLKTKRGVLYRVSIGPYDSLHLAEKQQVALRKQKFSGVIRRVV